MTSNIPVAEEASEAEIREALLAYFKPEFINRLDEVVRFKSLTRQQLRQIVELQVRQVAARLAERNIELVLSDDAKELLGNLGYDPAYGARPLRRVIQRQLTDRLALELLEGKIREGDLVSVDAADGQLVITASRRVAEPVGAGA